MPKFHEKVRKLQTKVKSDRELTSILDNFSAAGPKGIVTTRCAMDTDWMCKTLVDWTKDNSSLQVQRASGVMGSGAGGTAPLVWGRRVDAQMGGAGTVGAGGSSE